MRYVVRHIETRLFLCIDYSERLEREVDAYCADAATRFNSEKEARETMQEYKVCPKRFEIKPCRN